MGMLLILISNIVISLSFYDTMAFLGVHIVTDSDTLFARDDYYT